MEDQKSHYLDSKRLIVNEPRMSDTKDSLLHPSCNTDQGVQLMSESMDVKSKGEVKVK